jgi:hypothetical protein
VLCIFLYSFDMLLASFQVEDLLLSASWMRGALGKLGFALRELTEHGAMELLVTASNPRPVAKVVLRMVEQAVAHVMPLLQFALAVPADSGGRWKIGAKLHDADGDGERLLVILDGGRGLEARVAQAGAADVAVGSRKMRGAEVRRRFELWLPPKAESEWYDVAVLCRSREQQDLRLANAVAGRLADSVVGLLGMRVFVEDQIVMHTYTYISSYRPPAPIEKKGRCMIFFHVHDMTYTSIYCRFSFKIHDFYLS